MLFSAHVVVPHDFSVKLLNAPPGGVCFRYTVTWAFFDLLLTISGNGAHRAEVVVPKIPKLKESRMLLFPEPFSPVKANDEIPRKSRQALEKENIFFSSNPSNSIITVHQP